MPTPLFNSANKPLYYSAPPGLRFGATTVGQTLIAPNGNVLLAATQCKSDTLVGGIGDDTFLVGDQSDVVIVAPNSGTDTIISYATNYVLPVNVQNGVVGNGLLIGNSADNILSTTGAGTHLLNGGGGNDILIGGAGIDRFIIAAGQGNDVIMQFNTSTDVVELDGVSRLSTFAQVQAAMTQQGSDVVLNLGGGQNLTFRSITINQLTPSNFALPVNTSTMTMTFDDEFNVLNAGPSGQTWQTTISNGRTLPANHEAEYYSDSTVGVNPFSIKNGILDITATPGKNLPNGLTYTSGLLSTQKSFSQLYGYFEMRAELPAGAGMWPAFWLLPANGAWPPELDVMEMLGNDPSKIYTTTHSTTEPMNSIASYVPNTSAGFHTYGALWSAFTVNWYMDGNLIASTPTPADMHTAMYMVVNLAVGGAGSWPGAAAGETGNMLVDYVHAYQLADSMTGPTPSSAMLSGTVRLDALATGATTTTAPGLAGVTVTLLTAAGATTGMTAITDANGTYSFMGLTAGQYMAHFTAPAGETLLTTNSAAISLVAGQAALNVDNVAQPLVQTITTAGQKIIGNDSPYTITGNGGSTQITLGNGNQTINLVGSNEVIVLGNGTQTVSLNGTGNKVTVGSGTASISGASSITAAGGNTAIAVSGMSATTTYVALNGMGDSVTATGAGNFNIIDNGSSGATTVMLGAGNDKVTLSGGGNTVTLGAGSQIVNLNGSGNSVTIGNGISTISALGGGATISVAGVTAGGQTSIALSGTNNSVTATDIGNFRLTNTGSGGGNTVTLLAGNDSVALSGNGNTITLGSGNQVVTLSGSANKVTLGAGNQTVTLGGVGNSVSTGTGISVISALGGTTAVTVAGVTAGRSTCIALGGANNNVTATGNGSFQITGSSTASTFALLAGNDSITLSGGGNTVALGVGNQTVNLNGYGNTVTTGQGTSSIKALGGGATIHSLGGSNIITVSGTNNILDSGPGSSVLNGGAGNDVFIMNGATQGKDTINGFKLGIADVLDLTRTLAGTAVAADLSNIGRFIQSTTSGGNTTLYVDPTGNGGSPYAFATLQGVTTTIGTLLAQHDIQVNGHLS